MYKQGKNYLLRRIIEGILIFCFSLPLYSQNKLSYAEADRKTYAFYLAQQWDSLARVSKFAQKEGYDGYFLRMRYGIALYEKNRFRQAAKQFRGALSFSAESPDAFELLYYSYLMGGQEGRADHITRNFNNSLVKKINPDVPKFLNGIYTEGAYSYFNNSSLADQLWDIDAEGVQIMSRSFMIGTIQFEHHPARGFRIRQSFSSLAKEDYYYLKDPDVQLLLTDHRVRQMAYWISPAISTSSGLCITPFINITGIKYETVSEVTTGFGNRSQVNTYYTNETAYSGGISLKKNLGLLDLTLAGAATGHNGNLYSQAGGSATLYPFGNLSFYVKGAYYYRLYYSGSLYPGGGIIDGLLGFSIADKIWTELTGTKGYMFFYLENDGSIFYNNTDYPIFKSSFQVIIPLNNYKTTLFIGGRYAVHNSYYDYTNEEDIPDQWLPVEYNSFTFYTGIKWKIK